MKNGKGKTETIFDKHPEEVINELNGTSEPATKEVLFTREKILRISSELRITKDGKNTFAKYDYFKPDSILAALNPLLLKYSLFTYFNLIKDDNTYRGELTISDFTGVDSISFQMTTPPIEIKGANPVQSLGGLQTYLKRYLLMNAFNIAENGLDYDSNEMNNHKDSVQKISAETKKDIEKPKTNHAADLREYIKKQFPPETTISKKEAIDKLNELAQTSFKEFPTNENECGILLAGLLRGNGNG